MTWSIHLSLRASLYCAALVVVCEEELPEGFFGTVRFLWFPPVYLMRLRDRDDMGTFWHEAWHVRVMVWSKHEDKKSDILRLCRNCRIIVDKDPMLSALFRDVYERPGINAEDEAVIRLMERPDLQALLPKVDRDLLARLQRAAWMDMKTWWFRWLLTVAMVYWVVVSI